MHILAPLLSSVVLASVSNVAVSLEVHLKSARQIHLQRAGPHRGIDVVVLVRTFDPMPGMLERMRDIRDDLQMNAPNVQFALSIDNRLQTAEHIKTAVPGVLAHEYTWEDVQKQWPVHMQGSSWFDNGNARGWHIPAILLARRYILQMGDISQNASFWVVEDDVFICKGSLSQFIALYEDVQSDVLTMPYNNILLEEPGWVHREEATKAFLQRFGLSDRWMSWEQVQRFSQRFLDHVEKEVDSNISSQSEMFVATECMNNRQKFNCAVFKKEHVGHVSWSFRANSRLDAVQVCKDSPGLTMNHAAKFLGHG
jgi:hypothetical protein